MALSAGGSLVVESCFIVPLLFVGFCVWSSFVVQYLVSFLDERAGCFTLSPCSHIVVNAQVVPCPSHTHFLVCKIGWNI